MLLMLLLSSRGLPLWIYLFVKTPRRPSHRTRFLSVTLLAASPIFGRVACTIWSGVICHANFAIQPVLQSTPSSGFFFGNLLAQVSSSLNLAAMSSLVQRQRAPSSRGFFRRPAASSRGASSTAQTSSFSAGNNFPLSHHLLLHRRLRRRST